MSNDKLVDRNILAFDFDGVIHRYSKGYHDGTAYDGPMPGIREMFRKLEDQGYTIIINSARPADQISEWLERHGFPAYKIYQKPRARAYIDDRAIRFTNPTDLIKYFL